MIKFSAKVFLWFISLNICIILNTNPSFADHYDIIRPESSFVPDVNFFDENGEKVFLDQFEDKTLLLSFWASWCGSCVDELPSLDILQKDFHKLLFEVVAVSEDFKGIEAVRNHFGNYGIRHLKLYHDYKNELFKAMSVAGLPTAFLISPDGKIKAIFKGNIKWHDDKIRNILLAEIAGNPEMPKNSYISTSLNKKITPIMDNDPPKAASDFKPAAPKENQERQSKQPTVKNQKEQQNENNKQE